MSRLLPLAVIASSLPPVILSPSPPVILTLSVAKGKNLAQDKLREGSQKQDRFFALRAQNDMILQDYADVILSPSPPVILKEPFAFLSS
ncbi:MAG: hypothetical protein WCA51_03255 [Dehalococcoidia bacterium]